MIVKTGLLYPIYGPPRLVSRLSSCAKAEVTPRGEVGIWTHQSVQVIRNLLCALFFSLFFSCFKLAASWVLILCDCSSTCLCTRTLLVLQLADSCRFLNTSSSLRRKLCSLWLGWVSLTHRQVIVIIVMELVFRLIIQAKQDWRSPVYSDRF